MVWQLDLLEYRVTEDVNEMRKYFPALRRYVGQVEADAVDCVCEKLVD